MPKKKKRKKQVRKIIEKDWYIKGVYHNRALKTCSYVFAKVRTIGKSINPKIISNPKGVPFPRLFVAPARWENNLRLRTKDSLFSTGPYRTLSEFYLLSPDGFSDNIKCIDLAHDIGALTKNLTHLVDFVTMRPCEYNHEDLGKIASYIQVVNKKLEALHD